MRGETTREMPQLRTSRFEYSHSLSISSMFGALPLTHYLPFERRVLPFPMDNDIIHLADNRDYFDIF
jgi:hypothetical protein